MALNGIIEFIFEAFKRDSQIAGLLVKTTRLLPSLLDLLKYTMDHAAYIREQDCGSNIRLPIRNRGLMTIFIDKIVKILHICILHPREYSVDLITKFFTERPLDDTEGKVPRNWLYVVKMFRLVGSQHSTYFYGHIDVKLAICRFLAELLIRIPQSNCKETYLDETVLPFQMQKYLDKGYLEDEQDIDTFGGLLLLEFGAVFRALYVDIRD
jgi:hypothetical protein